MKFDRFDYTVWAVLAALGLAIAGAIWMGDQVGARVVEVFPEEGGQLGGLGRVGLTFAQPMRATSVEPLFTLDPPLPGKFVWEGQRLWFVPSQAYQPGQTYTARLQAGAASQGGQTVKEDVTWRFTARLPEIAYIAPASENREVWRISLEGGQPVQLTHTDGNVYDFAAAPDGERIIYSVLNNEKGLDLWQVTRDGEDSKLLVACGRDQCYVPTWSPDGGRVAYSRESAGVAPEAPNGPPRVWTVDVATGQTAPLYSDSQVLGYGPSWSPDGGRLAFFDGGIGSIRVLNLQTSEETLLPTQMGTLGSWSADEQEMLYSDLSFGGEQPFVTVYRAVFYTQEITPVLGRDLNFADYGPPAWSPDGQWMAISQRPPQGGATKQLWLMRLDGSEARSITDEPLYTHGGYHWDGWGTALVFQRFEIGQPYAQPELRVWTLATNEVEPLVRDATQAAWLP
jgi:TolB protein